MLTGQAPPFVLEGAPPRSWVQPAMSAPEEVRSPAHEAGLRFVGFSMQVQCRVQLPIPAAWSLHPPVGPVRMSCDAASEKRPWDRELAVEKEKRQAAEAKVKDLQKRWKAAATWLAVFGSDTHCASFPCRHQDSC